MYLPVSGHDFGYLDMGHCGLRGMGHWALPHLAPVDMGHHRAAAAGARDIARPQEQHEVQLQRCPMAEI